MREYIPLRLCVGLLISALTYFGVKMYYLYLDYRTVKESAPLHVQGTDSSVINPVASKLA